MIEPHIAHDLQKRHLKMVYAMGLRLTSVPADAENFTAEVFLKVFRRYDSLLDKTKEKAWVRKIALNHFKDQVGILKRVRRYIASRLENEEDDDEGDWVDQFPAPAELSPESELLSTEKRQLLEKAYALLPENLRLPLVMRDVLGISEEESAASLRITITQLRRQNFRARQKVAFRFVTLLLQSEIDRASDDQHAKIYGRFFSGYRVAVAVQAEDRYVQQNAAHRLLLGYADAELVGKPPTIVVGKENFSQVKRLLRRSDKVRKRFGCKKKDGTTCELDTLVMAVSNGDGGSLCQLWIHWPKGGRKDMSGGLEKVDQLACRAVRQAISDDINAPGKDHLQPEVEAHLNGCPTCQNATVWMRQTVRDLGRLGDQVTPPDGLSRKIFTQWETQRSVRRFVGASRLQPIWGLAALMLIGGGIALLVIHPESQVASKVAERSKLQAPPSTARDGSTIRAALTAYAVTPHGLQALSSGTRLQSGARFFIQVDLTQSAYLRATLRSSPGGVKELFPEDGEGYVQAGLLRIPRDGSLSLNQQPGMEVIEVWFSTAPLSKRDLDSSSLHGADTQTVSLRSGSEAVLRLTLNHEM